MFKGDKHKSEVPSQESRITGKVGLNEILFLTSLQLKLCAQRDRTLGSDKQPLA